MLEETHKRAFVIAKTGRQTGTRRIKTDVTYGHTGVSNQLPSCIMNPEKFYDETKKKKKDVAIRDERN